MIVGLVLLLAKEARPDPRRSSEERDGADDRSRRPRGDDRSAVRAHREQQAAADWEVIFQTREDLLVYAVPLSVFEGRGELLGVFWRGSLDDVLNYKRSRLRRSLRLCVAMSHPSNSSYFQASQILPLSSLQTR